MSSSERKVLTGQHTQWPEFPQQGWKETLEALHLWTQIIGKIRLARAPMTNHWWQVPLYLSSRGLTTSPIPHDSQVFQMDFDFREHVLRIETSSGDERRVALSSGPVSGFYQGTMRALQELQIPVQIWPVTVEMEEQVHLARDGQERTYIPEHAHRFWQILMQVDRVLKVFRSRYIGKASPVHFFWGSFDLAVTRFSGRPAAPHPGIPGLAKYVMEEAYSHELSSCGFWPGGGGADDAAFYAYAYPVLEGFKDYPVEPAEAFYSEPLQEFILPYNTMRESASPDETLLRFLQTTYEAAAHAGNWDRESLERSYSQPNKPSA